MINFFPSYWVRRLVPFRQYYRYLHKVLVGLLMFPVGLEQSQAQTKISFNETRGYSLKQRHCGSDQMWMTI